MASSDPPLPSSLPTVRPGAAGGARGGVAGSSVVSSSAALSDPPYSLPPQVCLVIGMAGSGKTTLMQRINAHVHEKGIPSYGSCPARSRPPAPSAPL